MKRGPVRWFAVQDLGKPKTAVETHLGAALNRSIRTFTRAPQFVGGRGTSLW
jgi:hypothetical protein